MNETQFKKSFGMSILNILFINACKLFDFRSPWKGQFLAVDFLWGAPQVRFDCFLEEPFFQFLLACWSGVTYRRDLCFNMVFGAEWWNVDWVFIGWCVLVFIIAGLLGLEFGSWNSELCVEFVSIVVFLSELVDLKNDPFNFHKHVRLPKQNI